MSTEHAKQECAPAAEQVLQAAEQMDWQQVVQNGGPPCFHLCGENFCGRAKTWVGHKTMVSNHVIDHDFVSLAELLRAVPSPAQEKPEDTKPEITSFLAAIINSERDFILPNGSRLQHAAANLLCAALATASPSVTPKVST